MEISVDYSAPKRKKKHRAGRRHKKIKSERIAGALGLKWPLNQVSPQVTAEVAETQAEPPPAPQPIGNPAAIARGVIEKPDDVAMIREMLLAKTWQIPKEAHELLPQDVMLFFYGKIRKGNVLEDVNLKPGERIMAARTLVAMSGQNIRAVSKLLPPTAQLHLHQHRDERPVSTDDQRAIALAAIAAELAKRTITGSAIVFSDDYGSAGGGNAGQVIDAGA